MENDELGNWRRLGAAVRRARLDLGITNRSHLADECNISARVLADIEAGVRANFSRRVMDRIEAGLGWPTGTIDQIVSDATFTPPTPRGDGGLVFRRAVFDRRPIPVEIGAIENAIYALDEARRTGGSNATTVHAALLAQCWPYVTRLLEDNCRPGIEVHPAVRPFYDAFTLLSAWASPNDPPPCYAQWLVGDATTVDESTRQRYMQRWSSARRVRGGGLPPERVVA